MEDSPLKNNSSVYTKMSATPISKYRTGDELLETAAIDVYQSLITDFDSPDESVEIRWLRHERLAHKSLHWTRRPSLLMIGTVTFLLAFAMGFSILSKIELLLLLLCRSQFSDEMGTIPSVIDISACDRLQTQIELSQLESVISLVSGLISMGLSSKIGQLSDMYGRKYLLLWNVLTLFVGFASSIVLLRPSVTRFHRTFLIIAGCVNALGGGMSSTGSLSYSYIIDTVEEEERIYSMGILSASIAIGLSLGPMASSQLIKYVFNSPISALYVSCILMGFLVLFVLFILPESRSERSRKKSRDNSISLHELRRAILLELEASKRLSHQTFEMVKSFFTPLKLLWLPVTQEDGSKDYRPRLSLLLLISADVFWNLSAVLMMITTSLYATYVFNWDSIQLGYYISINSGSKLILLLLLSPVILNFIKKHATANKYLVDGVDLTTMRFSYTFQLISVTGLVLAQNTTEFMFAGSLDGLSSLCTPALRSSIVKYAPADSTGAMLGAISAVDSLVSLIGPPLALSIYSKTVKTHPKAILLVVLGILLICGSILFLLLGAPKENTTRDEDVSEQS